MFSGFELYSRWAPVESLPMVRRGLHAKKLKSIVMVLDDIFVNSDF